MLNLRMPGVPLLQHLGLPGRIGWAYGPVMNHENAGWTCSELDATRVARTLAAAFLIRYVVLPIVKWILLLLLIAALLLVIP